MASSLYGSVPDGYKEHDKLLIETQTALLKRINAHSSASSVKDLALAYALISGHLGAVPVEVKNG